MIHGKTAADYEMQNTVFENMPEFCLVNVCFCPNMDSPEMGVIVTPGDVLPYYVRQ